MVDSAGIEAAFAAFATPFQALKTAEQNVQFAIDPSKGLTRLRYGWFSNGTLFDSTLFTEPSGEIQVATRDGQADDIARLRSAFAGQYVAQALAQPGIEVAVDAPNVSIDGDGFASLSHGQVFAGTFWWDTGSSAVETGIGFDYNASRVAVFWRSGSSHLGDSPVAQSDWNLDTMNGQGAPENPSGLTFDPSDGWVTNDIYWWYNRGRLTIALVDPATNRLIPVHQFIPRTDEPGEPNLATPSMPTQVVVDNDGTGDVLTATVGGTQYSLYGAEGTPETRDTYGTNKGVDVTTDTPAAIDPTTTTGEPIYAVQRESGEKDLELRLGELRIDTPNDVTVYFYDEWDPATALTGASFEDTFRFNESETKTQFDRSATAYAPETAVFRGLTPVDSGQKNQETVAAADIDDRIPIGATRIVTATDDGGNNPAATVYARNLEGF